MKWGAVALIDALGFKGIWRRSNPDGVLTKMSEMASMIEDRLRQFKLIGPAVDEVAASEALAEGAFIWFLPSARKAEEEFGRSVLDKDLAHTYRVPLKGGNSFKTSVVDPITFLNAVASDSARPATKLSELLNAMDSERFEVVIKRDNTFHYYEKVCPSVLHDAIVIPSNS